MQCYFIYIRVSGRECWASHWDLVHHISNPRDYSSQQTSWIQTTNPACCSETFAALKYSARTFTHKMLGSRHCRASQIVQSRGSHSSHNVMCDFDWYIHPKPCSHSRSRCPAVFANAPRQLTLHDYSGYSLLGHVGNSIFSLQIHPNQQQAVTLDESGCILLWRTHPLSPDSSLPQVEVWDPGLRSLEWLQSWKLNDKTIAWQKGNNSKYTWLSWLLAFMPYVLSAWSAWSVFDCFNIYLLIMVNRCQACMTRVHVQFRLAWHQNTVHLERGM